MSDFLVKTSGQKLDSDNSVKTLMLLHGWGMNSKVWEPIREYLETRYQILWVDLPGHGFNRDIKAQSLAQMVEVITALTPNNTHIIGWSLGGLVAQLLAQQIPDKINSLTLVTSTPRFSQKTLLQTSPQTMPQKSKHVAPQTSQQESSQLSISNSKQKLSSLSSELSADTKHVNDQEWLHAMSDVVLNRFADNLKKDTEKTLKGFIALQFLGVKNAKQTQDNLIQNILYNNKTSYKWGGVILDDDLGAKTASNNIPSQEALDVGLTILKDADLRSLTATCPEHWIFAEYDRLIPKEVINDLISLRPDAEITLLEKAGHAPFITHREAFLSRMIDFIEAQLK